MIARAFRTTPRSRAEGAASAFSLFSASSAVLSVASVAVPELLLSTILPEVSTTNLDVFYLRVAGATLALACSVEFCLQVMLSCGWMRTILQEKKRRGDSLFLFQNAAANNLLASATYRKLSAAAAAKSVGYLYAFTQASG